MKSGSNFVNGGSMNIGKQKVRVRVPIPSIFCPQGYGSGRLFYHKSAMDCQ
jgi:hypothetical protein